MEKIAKKVMEKKITKTTRSRPASDSAEAIVYNKEGQESGSLSLPKEIFGLPWNSDLVHQVVVSMESNTREGTAHAKARADVRGGGKKPWKQKGTGRARHGSSRSPIWKGGGVTHGPTSLRNYDKKINRKMKLAALFTVLSRKYRDNEILFVEEVVPAVIKTKEASQAMLKLSKVKGFEKLAYKKGKRALLTLPAESEKAWKSFRNLATIKVDGARNLNPNDLLSYKYLIMSEPKESISVLERRLESSKAKK